MVLIEANKKKFWWKLESDFKVLKTINVYINIYDVCFSRYSIQSQITVFVQVSKQEEDL